MSRQTRKALILSTVDDLVLDLMDYGRREDVELDRGEIEEALCNGEITVAEIVAAFANGLTEWLES